MEFSALSFPNTITPPPSWVIRRAERLAVGERLLLTQRMGVWMLGGVDDTWVWVGRQKDGGFILKAPTPKRPLEFALPAEFHYIWRCHFHQNIHPLAAQLLNAVSFIESRRQDDERTVWTVGDGGISFVTGFAFDGHTWSVYLPSDFHSKDRSPATRYTLNGEPSPGGDKVSDLAKRNGLSAYCMMQTWLGVDGVRVSAVFGGEV